MKFTVPFRKQRHKAPADDGRPPQEEQENDYGYDDRGNDWNEYDWDDPDNDWGEYDWSDANSYENTNTLDNVCNNSTSPDHLHEDEDTYEMIPYHVLEDPGYEIIPDDLCDNPCEIPCQIHHQA